ncbi:MAG TPA: hypothetical protein VGX23_07545 [Actinocrinis sp.]|nr:hypothetical protein [Actinocrinis sp.]
MNPYAQAPAPADVHADVHFEELWLLGERISATRAEPPQPQSASPPPGPAAELATEPAPLPASSPAALPATHTAAHTSAHAAKPARHRPRVIGPLPVGAALVAVIGYALNVLLHLSVATSIVGGFVLAALGALTLRPLLIGDRRSRPRTPSPSARSLPAQGPR